MKTLNDFNHLHKFFAELYEGDASVTVTDINKVYSDPKKAKGFFCFNIYVKSDIISSAWLKELQGFDFSISHENDNFKIFVDIDF